MHRLLTPVYILCGFVLAPQWVTYGQSPSRGEGILTLSGWPESAFENAAVEGYTLLPYMESFTIGYRYSQTQSPHFISTIEWTPGLYGILDGKKVAYAALPEDLRLVALEFTAGVYIENRNVTDLIITIDSMSLGPRPDLQQVELSDISWDYFFVETEGDLARSYFEKGFELRRLRINHAVFASFDSLSASVYTESQGNNRSTRSNPQKVGVYKHNTVVSIVYDLDWLYWPDRYVYRPPRTRATGATTHEPRGQVGRGLLTSGANSRGDSGEGGHPTGDDDRDRSSRNKENNKSDDDDDDENNLLPAALTAIAAVGIIAYAGGTIGYFGNPEYTPFGLTSGFVRPGGGLMLQAAVNEPVLFGGDDTSRLLIRIMGFRDLFRTSVQPSMAIGAMAVEDDGRVEITPSYSIGAVINTRSFLLMWGYDFQLESYEFGIAFTFRGKEYSTDHRLR